MPIEHVSIQRTREKKEEGIDVESRYMAEVLVSFGKMYGAKEDAKVGAHAKMNLKITKVNILAQERIYKAHVEVDERMAKLVD